LKKKHEGVDTLQNGVSANQKILNAITGVSLSADLTKNLNADEFEIDAGNEQRKR